MPRQVIPTGPEGRDLSVVGLRECILIFLDIVVGQISISGTAIRNKEGNRATVPKENTVEWT